MAFVDRNSPQARMERASASIMSNKEFIALSGVLMIGKTVVTSDPKKWEQMGMEPTACTDGLNEWYYDKFVDTLTDAELRFLRIHEAYHKMYRHMITWQHLNAVSPQAAGAAMDYVINGELMKTEAAQKGFIAMPTIKSGPHKGKICGLHDPKYDGMDTKQVFDIIMRNAIKINIKPNGDGKSGGFDMHDFEGAKGMSKKEQQKLAAEIDRALRQGAILAGKEKGGLDRTLEGLLETKVRWQEQLQEYVSTIMAGSDFSTWSRPNRRYLGAGIVMPTGISQAIGEITVNIDTSGSIGGTQIKQFLGEVKGICDAVKPDALHLTYWDTAVCGYEKYERADLMNIEHKTKPKGGGGTDLTCVPPFFREKNIKPKVHIVLTDGYVGGWGTWDEPVIFCIIGSDQPAPFGVSIFVDPADLEG